MTRAAAIIGLLLVVGTSARAQPTRCDFDAPGGASVEVINGMTITRGGGKIKVDCKSRGIRLSADSGEKFGEERIELYGRVEYDEPSRISLKSDFLTYSMREEKVNVRGHVTAMLPNGSTLTGPEATHWRAVPRVRAIEELLAVRGPTITIASRNPSEKSVVVNANTIFLKGDSLIYASRSVVIDRADLVARADSAFLDGRTGVETIRLMFKPSVEGREGREFKLEGEIIDAFSKNRKLDRVLARGKGHAISRDLDLVADSIDLRMTNDKMERAIAWNHTGQAKATSPGQVITADSIDVRMPGSKVRVAYAIRNARADADADTVRFRTTERDWLSGDTVTAWFDSTASKDTAARKGARAAADSSKTPPLELIVARHKGAEAKAYYHLPASDTSIKTPAIGYVRGREIRIEFSNRKIGIVSVRDSVAGMYLEPKRDSTAKAATKPAAKPPVRR